MQYTLKELRARKGARRGKTITQTIAAKEMGINPMYYVGLEKLNRDTIAKIAKYYGVTADEIKIGG